jgi:uncharacterized protein
MAYHIPTEITDRIDEYVHEVKKDIPVDAVYLFGSHARGNAGPASDIDLAVISPKFGTDTTDDTTALAMKVWNVSYKNFDVIGYSPDYFKYGFSPLLHEIRKYAVRVA